MLWALNRERPRALAQATGAGRMRARALASSAPHAGAHAGAGRTGVRIKCAGARTSSAFEHVCVLPSSRKQARRRTSVTRYLGSSATANHLACPLCDRPA
eukprot:2763888-Pleurochrysis_carterae.AAC.1